jgi:hypothetical protein
VTKNAFAIPLIKCRRHLYSTNPLISHLFQSLLCVTLTRFLVSSASHHITSFINIHLTALHHFVFFLAGYQ